MNVDQLFEYASQKISPQDPHRSFKLQKLSEFKKTGLNEIIKESYSLTPLNQFLSSIDLSQGTPSSFEISTHKDFQGPVLYFQDGELVFEKQIPSFVKLRSLKDLTEEELSFFTQTHPLAALEQGLLKNGLIIEINKECSFNSPLRIVHLIKDAPFVHPTFLIVMKENTQCSIVEEIQDLSQSGAFYLSETYVSLAKGSHLEHVFIKNHTDQLNSHCSLNFDLQENSTLESLVIHGAGKLSRTNAFFHLKGKGAFCRSHALYLSAGTEHSDIFTQIHHHSPDTTSAQLCKGLLSDQSKGIFSGTIVIDPKSQRVSASQLNKNLLLSPKAQAFSKPQLEIFADDVKCSHGSTTGELSSDEIFYFQSRGLTLEMAKNLLSMGFALDTLSFIHSENLKNELSGMILDLLKKKFSTGHKS